MTNRKPIAENKVAIVQDLTALHTRAENERLYDTAGESKPNPWRGSIDEFEKAKAVAEQIERTTSAHAFIEDLHRYDALLTRWFELRRAFARHGAEIERLGDAREHYRRFQMSGLVPQRPQAVFTPFPDRQPPPDEKPYRAAFARGFLRYCDAAGVPEQHRAQLLERLEQLEASFDAQQPPTNELKGVTQSLERIEAVRDGFRDIREERLRNE